MLARGRPAPQWCLEEPDIPPGAEFYIKAFWDLTTERQIGMSVGPIPASRIRRYGEHAGLDSTMMGVLSRVIRTMDTGFLKWIKNEQDKQAKRTAK